jgi:hypothetical protein
MLSFGKIIWQAPVSASGDGETRARSLSTDQVHQLRDDFIAAAVRCDRAGFDGVELPGAAISYVSSSVKKLIVGRMSTVAHCRIDIGFWKKSLMVFVTTVARIFS